MKPTPNDTEEAEAEIKRLEDRADQMEKNGYRCQAAHLRQSIRGLCVSYGIKEYD